MCIAYYSIVAQYHHKQDLPKHIGVSREEPSTVQEAVAVVASSFATEMSGHEKRPLRPKRPQATWGEPPRSNVGCLTWSAHGQKGEAMDLP